MLCACLLDFGLKEIVLEQEKQGKDAKIIHQKH